MIVPFKLLGGWPGYRHRPGFGVWKQPTGKKRCPAITRLTSRWGKKCIRPIGHAGFHGWEHFSGRVAP